MVTEVAFEGLSRTHEPWIRDFILIRPPEAVSELDLAAIRGKLLSTGVFRGVETSLEAKAGGGNRLVITVKEQWTLIPVIRGGYGGGTPFSVYGLYDSHVLGRLWTMGVQTFQFGNSPPGGVVWAKAPQWLTGEYTVSIEAWLDRRRRGIHDRDSKAGDEALATVENRAGRLRAFFFGPALFLQAPLASKFLSFPFRIGLDATVERVQPSRLVEGLEPVSGFGYELASEEVTDLKIEGMALYDNMQRFVSDEDGVRGLAKAGLLTEEGKALRSFSGEFFFYRLWPDYNFAWHAKGMESQASRFDHLNFVGGLNAVRGYPDGYLFGPRAAVTNVELRHVGFKGDDFWYQGLIFVDAGWAGRDWNRLKDNHLASFGCGLRLVVPRISRFMLRLDYGWSLTDPSFRGISAGFNQFFQSYKPLDDAP